MEKAQQTMRMQETISALADGELDSRQAQVAIDLLLGCATARDFWDELHATGDYLRSDETAATSGSAFVKRFSVRLEAEPVVLAPHGRAAGRSSGWLRFGLPSASIAAGIAMVLWIAVPQMTKPAAEVAGSTLAEGARDTVAQASAPSTTIPASVQLMDPDQVGEYLTAHQGSVQAASLTILSNKAESRP